MERYRPYLMCKSGTEPIPPVMVEAGSKKISDKYVDQASGAIKRHKPYCVNIEKPVNHRRIPLRKQIGSSVMTTTVILKKSNVGRNAL